MEVARPTINEALERFLAEQRTRLSPATFRRYEDVVGLLRHCMDGYAGSSSATSWSARSRRVRTSSGRRAR